MWERAWFHYRAAENKGIKSSERHCIQRSKWAGLLQQVSRHRKTTKLTQKEVKSSNQLRTIKEI